MNMKTIRSLSKPLFSGVLLVAGLSSVTGSAQAQAAGEAQARMIEMLQGADTNKDGQLTKAELSKALQERFGMMDRNRNGWVNADDAPGFGRSTFMDRVMPIVKERDANGDGKLTYAEFAKRPMDVFTTVDTDANSEVQLSVLIDAIKAGGRR